MPQMYPMNWLILFFIFLILFFMINSMNYFYKLPILSKGKKMCFLKFKLNWLW
uniref:ATP synthase complex subunit 8 n=1 Tax=Cephalcia yanqingensis TaxID=2853409 RepID=A0A8H2SJ36_9HYME|nr:ATP synthase F0 subunit 8 [Cephalcia yanqingensis]